MFFQFCPKPKVCFGFWICHLCSKTTFLLFLHFWSHFPVWVCLPPPWGPRRYCSCKGRRQRSCSSVCSCERLAFKQERVTLLTIKSIWKTKTPPGINRKLLPETRTTTWMIAPQCNEENKPESTETCSQAHRIRSTGKTVSERTCSWRVLFQLKIQERIKLCSLERQVTVLHSQTISREKKLNLTKNMKLLFSSGQLIIKSIPILPVPVSRPEGTPSLHDLNHEVKHARLSSYKVSYKTIMFCLQSWMSLLWNFFCWHKDRRGKQRRP